MGTSHVRGIQFVVLFHVRMNQPAVDDRMSGCRVVISTV